MIIQLSLYLCESKYRKLQETIEIKKIVYDKCTNGYISSLSEFLLILASDITQETSFAGKLTNGQSSFEFTCVNNNNTSIKCTLKEATSIKGDYTISSLSGTKYKYVSKIPTYALLRVTDQPAPEPEVTSTSFFKGVEFQVEPHNTTSFPPGNPEMYIQEKDSYLKFTCNSVDKKTMCKVPPETTDLGQNLDFYYRNGCGEIVSNNQIGVIKIFDIVNLSGNIFVKQNSKSDIELIILSNSKTSFNYSLISSDSKSNVNMTCKTEGNISNCKVYNFSSTKEITYNLLCEIFEKEFAECHKNSVIVYSPIENSMISVSFEDGSNTKIINEIHKISFVFPVVFTKIEDSPFSKVRGVSIDSKGKKVTLEECDNFVNNNTHTTFQCNILAEEIADVSVLYKNQPGENVEISMLKFNDSTSHAYTLCVLTTKKGFAYLLLILIIFI